MIVCALYCVFFLGKFLAIASYRGICNEKCCAHYFKQHDVCIECHNGTYRDEHDDPDICKSCPEGKYGYRCTEQCICKTSTHTCDLVNGRCCCLINGVDCVEDYSCGSKGETKQTKTEGTFLFGIIISMVVCAAVIFGIILSALRNTENCVRRDLSRCFGNLSQHVIENHIMPSQANQAGCDIENDDTSEGHYCDIRDSAIIQNLTSIQDGLHTEDYNHLNLSCSVETWYKCNENVYFKLSKLKASENNQTATNENTGTIYHYDQMETLNSRTKSVKHPNYNTMSDIKAEKNYQAQTDSRRNESIGSENTTVIPMHIDNNSDNNTQVILINVPINDDVNQENSI